MAVLSPVCVCLTNWQLNPNLKGKSDIILFFSKPIDPTNKDCLCIQSLMYLILLYTDLQFCPQTIKNTSLSRTVG